MKILPITNIINNYKIRQAQNVQPSMITAENLKPLACDTVSFGRCPGDKALKSLLPYGIPDIYTGKIMIPFEELQNIMRRKIFSFPLKRLVKYLKNYEDCLHDVPSEIFEMLKKQAKVNPNDRLENVIHKLLPEHNAKLIKEQEPIFEELKEIAKEMPEEQFNEFMSLMEMTESQIRNEQVYKPFDVNDFRYKLKRIIERNKSRNIPKENRALKKLKNLALLLPDDSEQEMIQRKYKRLTKKKKTFKQDIIDRNIKNRIIATIRLMNRVIDNSPLAYDKELKQLLTTAKMQIYDVKIVCPFQRKAFIIELSRIVEELEDNKLAHRLMQCATKLPNSSESVSAFIVKSAESSAQKILYDLLYPSVGSTEHLQPSKSGGKDSVSNYALASSLINSQRAHMGFATWLRKHPEVYENCQKYVDRLIELYNAGVFKEVGLGRDYIIHFAALVYKLSPKEKPLVLDLSKLRNR